MKVIVILWKFTIQKWFYFINIFTIASVSLQFYCLNGTKYHSTDLISLWNICDMWHSLGNSGFANKRAPGSNDIYSFCKKLRQFYANPLSIWTWPAGVLLWSSVLCYGCSTINTLMLETIWQFKSWLSLIRLKLTGNTLFPNSEVLKWKTEIFCLDSDNFEEDTKKDKKVIIFGMK